MTFGKVNGQGAGFSLRFVNPIWVAAHRPRCGGNLEEKKTSFRSKKTDRPPRPFVFIPESAMGILGTPEAGSFIKFGKVSHAACLRYPAFDLPGCWTRLGRFASWNVVPTGQYPCREARTPCPHCDTVGGNETAVSFGRGSRKSYSFGVRQEVSPGNTPVGSGGPAPRSALRVHRLQRHRTFFASSQAATSTGFGDPNKPEKGTAHFDQRWEVAGGESPTWRAPRLDPDKGTSPGPRTFRRHSRGGCGARRNPPQTRIPRSLFFREISALAPTQSSRPRSQVGGEPVDRSQREMGSGSEKPRSNPATFTVDRPASRMPTLSQSGILVAGASGMVGE